MPSSQPWEALRGAPQASYKSFKYLKSHEISENAQKVFNFHVSSGLSLTGWKHFQSVIRSLKVSKKVRKRSLKVSKKVLKSFKKAP